MKESNIAIAEIGDTIEFTSDSMRRGERFPAGSLFIDGYGVDGTDSFVLRDRIHLSEDGLVVVVVGIDELSSELSSLEIVCKGVVLTDSAVAESKTYVENALKQIDLRKVSDDNELSGIIRRSLKNHLFKSTKKNPMILPIIMVV